MPITAFAPVVRVPTPARAGRSVSRAVRCGSRVHNWTRRSPILTSPKTVTVKSTNHDTLNGGASTSSPSLVSLLTQLKDAAGTKNGTDCDEAGAGKVKEVIAKICERDDGYPNPNAVDLAGTSWELTYSDSAGNSSGKLGPFVGIVTQEFEVDKNSGRYRNVVTLGPLVLSLAAVAEALAKSKKNESLKVTFVDLTVTIFGNQVLKKPFDANRSGTWRMAYASDEVRVLYTNQGNVFVLTRA
jgi:hypothetical protein